MPTILFDSTKDQNANERSPLTHSSFPQPREAAASLLSAQDKKRSYQRFAIE
jgi:hypothetical protein